MPHARARQASRTTAEVIRAVARRFQRAHARGGPVAPDEHAADAIGGGDAQDCLDGRPIQIAAIAAEHQGFAGAAFQGVKNGLNEILEIVRLLKNGDLLAQPGGSRLLVRVRLRCDSAYVHGGTFAFKHNRAPKSSGT